MKTQKPKLGRPPEGRKYLHARVKPETVAAIAARQTESLNTPGKVIDAFFLSLPSLPTPQ